MSREELLKKVVSIISESLDIEEEKIKEDSRLIEDLDVDSLELVDLTMDFETELEVNIEDSQVENIRTVKDIVNILQEKLN
ncbi:acyl carrier protein [Oceanotoga sp. DSM 15011]|jgi:acyl carrier protein|uniref:Acyl carrier protein n=1 Tax=Oceanotoga teriensis TaxID=515440 RepID=A0AA45C826_9BACT|nr:MULTISPECIES: acyl carrier protein [Oceanotoga]MDN5341304.1 acyl carrier protein [Oceanotoga sp.]MDO7976969.1 acyl carrier protein [Oceanotoga teriensis]PWJ95729.1 acyl carrier protein [Oceanotoga teriensis]UYO99562.1 acyl carrier protein [Oceanotoga sp. DSM 15011]